MSMHAHTVPAHTMMLTFKLVHLGLLFGRKCLVERSLCLGMCHSHLRGKSANCIGRLLDSCGIVLLNCRLQAVMGRPHLVVGGFSVVRHSAENGCRLLLLLRGQRELFGEKIQ